MKTKSITTYMQRLVLASALVLGALSLVAVSQSAKAETAEEIHAKSTRALQSLYRTNPTAYNISKHAKAVLIFPSIVKAGLVVGGAYGEGALFRGGRVTSYYNSVTASWGLQAGAETYGYAVFLMSDKAVRYLDRSEGWEIGVGPRVVVVNDGVGKNLSTSTLKDDAYAFIFNQQGLMASLSLEGSKISRIHR